MDWETNTRDIQEFRQLLLEWYAAERRRLPWRETRDPYLIWVSEVMLQQTQVKTVISYFAAFITAFPTVAALAAASLDSVLKAWEGLGYYARARNLHKAAKYIVAHYNSRIPESYDALRKIPGIGAYTAAAIASIAFAEPRAVLDGNVRRVLARLFLLRGNLQRAGAKEKLQNLAGVLLDRKRPGDFNQALMELGAILCSPRKPACLICPVSAHCGAFQNLENPAELPERIPRQPLPHYDIAVGLIWDEGYLFIDKRREDGLLGGMWEFPGGKIEPGETAPEAVKREILEELDLDVEVGEFFMEVRHAYSHFRITLHVYHCIYRDGEPRLNAATDWRWVKPDELKFFAFATANKKIIQRLDTEFAAENGGRSRT